MIKSILVALDASPRAPHVFAAAVSLATAFGASLRVYRAVSLPVDHPAAAHESHRVSLETFLANQVEQELRLLAAPYPPAQIETTVPTYGVAWRLICEKATSLGVDLLVIGSHGYRGWDRLLGTTAAQVVNHSPTNTFVVRVERPA